MWCQGPALAAFEQRSRGRTPRSKRGAENAQSTGKVQSRGRRQGPARSAAVSAAHPAVMRLQKVQAKFGGLFKSGSGHSARQKCQAIVTHFLVKRAWPDAVPSQGTGQLSRRWFLHHVSRKA